MSELTLGDLVQNGTMSPEIGATLAVAAEERRSFLFVAIPRLAGKTTTLRAALRHVPPGTRFHSLARSAGPSLGIPEAADGGYLFMAEIADTGFDDYLWGDEVRHVFEALGRGFSLATSLHAGGVDEAFDIITRQNGVPDAHAARIDLVVYIRSLGRDWENPDRRVVAEVHEVQRVAGGRPDAICLHRWVEKADRFEAVASPRRVGSISGTFNAHLAVLRPFASGRQG
jgi:type IV secretory pathway ATPase VirB11/archaellum biosynthesis ATPase